MKISVAAAAFVGVTLLTGGQAVYSLANDQPTNTPVVTEPSEEPEVEEPQIEEPEVDEPEVPLVDEPETEEPEDETVGGPEAAAEHREAMAAWKDCVGAAVEAVAVSGESTDVLALCGTKPHPPGKALGWDGEKVSKSAQHKVDKAAGDKPEKAPKAEKQAKPQKAPKAKKA